MQQGKASLENKTDNKLLQAKKKYAGALALLKINRDLAIIEFSKAKELYLQARNEIPQLFTVQDYKDLILCLMQLFNFYMGPPRQVDLLEQCMNEFTGLIETVFPIIEEESVRSKIKNMCRAICFAKEKLSNRLDQDPIKFIEYQLEILDIKARFLKETDEEEVVSRIHACIPHIMQYLEFIISKGLGIKKLNNVIEKFWKHVCDRPKLFPERNKIFEEINSKIEHLRKVLNSKVEAKSSHIYSMAEARYISGIKEFDSDKDSQAESLFKEALIYYQAAQETNQPINSQHMADCLVKLCIIYGWRNDHEPAEEYGLRCLKLLAEEKYFPNEARNSNYYQMWCDVKECLAVAPHIKENVERHIELELDILRVRLSAFMELDKPSEKKIIYILNGMIEGNSRILVYANSKLKKLETLSPDNVKLFRSKAIKWIEFFLSTLETYKAKIKVNVNLDALIKQLNDKKTDLSKLRVVKIHRTPQPKKCDGKKAAVPKPSSPDNLVAQEVKVDNDLGAKLNLMREVGQWDFSVKDIQTKIEELNTLQDTLQDLPGSLHEAVKNINDSYKKLVEKATRLQNFSTFVKQARPEDIKNIQILQDHKKAHNNFNKERGKLLDCVKNINAEFAKMDLERLQTKVRHITTEIETIHSQVQLEQKELSMLQTQIQSALDKNKENSEFRHAAEEFQHLVMNARSETKDETAKTEPTLEALDPLEKLNKHYDELIARKTATLKKLAEIEDQKKSLTELLTRINTLRIAKVDLSMLPAGIESKLPTTSDEFANKMSDANAKKNFIWSYNDLKGRLAADIKEHFELQTFANTIGELKKASLSKKVNPTEISTTLDSLTQMVESFSYRCEELQKRTKFFHEQQAEFLKNLAAYFAPKVTFFTFGPKPLKIVVAREYVEEEQGFVQHP